ncbi:MAG: hypothetical protein WBN95_07090 [Gammaproteobacteria bacterium]
MVVKKAPHKHVTSLATEKVIATLAEGVPLNQAQSSDRLSANGQTGTEIRIHRDGLLIAKCYATGIAPSRLFIAIDPLHYPVNSRLEIEFVNGARATTKSVRLPATVMSRSARGIELRLDPALSRHADASD